MIKNILIVLLAVALIIVGIVAFKGRTNNKTSQATVPAKNTQAQPQSFQDLLTRECGQQQDTMEVKLLPMTFSNAVISKYNLQSQIECYPQGVLGTKFQTETNGTRALISTVKSTPDAVESKSIRIGDKSSKDWLMDYHYGLLKDAKPDLIIGDTSVYVVVMQPGPYGLNNRHVWVVINAFSNKEKYIVSAEETITFEPEPGDKLFALIKKYADSDKDSRTPEEIEGGIPQYVVQKRYEEFRNEFIKTYIKDYPNVDSTYKTVIDSLISDVQGVTAK